MSLTDFFGTDGDADDFAMPGDEALAATLGLTEPAEPVVEAEPETVEPEAAADEPEATDEPEQAEDDRPRNPDGTFAPKETPELILGKFKSADELAAAYQELESFKGRQQSEIGQLRQALEERFTAIEQQAARPAAPASWDDLIEDNPAQAVKLAYEHGETSQLRRAAEAWEQVSPGAYDLWADNVRMRAENEERFARYDAALAPVQQQATTSALVDGVAGLRAKYPDIHEFVQTDQFAELAEQIPLAKKALLGGTPDEVVSAVEVVYLSHRGRASDNLKDTARDVARSAAEEAQTMREEAFVASATATTATPRVSKADEYSAGWDDTDKVFDAGWNI